MSVPTRLPLSLKLSWENIITILFNIAALMPASGAGSQEELEGLNPENLWAGGRVSTCFWWSRSFSLLLPPMPSLRSLQGSLRAYAIKSSTFVQSQGWTFHKQNPTARFTLTLLLLAFHLLGAIPAVVSFTFPSLLLCWSAPSWNGGHFPAEYPLTLVM